MIKKNDLRIGNYVYHKHPIGMQLPAIIESGDDIDVNYAFSPIPLTEDIQHLHQLQNLYYCLTGEELKYISDEN